ncbi:MAG: SDR family oxidoreductase [Bacteroidales bacterium]|nr:SDR family oxidoreductase [Bacteroidales bacterium]
MKILLTGVTGYIGQNLLPALLAQGHMVICCVRDVNRFDTTKYPEGGIEVIEVNFLKPSTLSAIPKDIEFAYYLIHSMSAADEDFEQLEKESAMNFKEYIEKTKVRQVIYLSGIVNENNLSKHLQSRKGVEDILAQSSFVLTTLRAGIIVGSGSASFEIIRDLVEKLPIMIAPRWLKTKSQPIAIRNVVQFLTGVLNNSYTFKKSFDIGGPEILTYKDLLLIYARVRGLKRLIITVPVMTPKLSSYWLYFVTSTSYTLATHLVKSMRVEVICRDNDLAEKLNILPLTYEKSIQLAFNKIATDSVGASWTDALSSHALDEGISKLMEVPTFGCYKDERVNPVKNPEETLHRIWSIGGQNGWYYADWLWHIRGMLDKMAGGVGLRRGRKNATQLHAGEALDFWRVIDANREEKRLLLYAEMKLPGEAWLEFKITDNQLIQTATFRPLGLWGRMYWYAVLPFHGFIFKNMGKKLAEG